MLCGSNTKYPTLKQSLTSVNFPELIFSIKSSKLKFDNIEGVFKQVANDDPLYRKSTTEIDKVVIEEEKIKKEINVKKEKFKYVKSKIEEIDKKIETMMKILCVDINERDYVNDLKNKCGDLKYGDLKNSNQNDVK
jgi:hypothetical protein